MLDLPANPEPQLEQSLPLLTEHRVPPILASGAETFQPADLLSRRRAASLPFGGYRRWLPL